MKTLLQIGFIGWALLYLTVRVSAHVSLNPREGVVGYQTFTVRVPTEKEIPTVEVRLVVPESIDVHGVMPVFGWTHTEKREEPKQAMDGGEKAEGEDQHGSEGRITEITWSGGKIGDGEYMEFPINVNYAGEPATLTWKAYQKYSDGTVVAWDGTSEKEPAPKVDMKKVATVDSLAAKVAGLEKGSASGTNGSGQFLAIGAFLLSVAALGVAWKSKQS